MKSDPFAAIRKADTGVSASFAADLLHPLHPENGPVLREKAQKTATVHLLHPLHPEIAESEIEGGNRVDPALTVPEIGETEYQGLSDEWRDGLRALNRMGRPRSIAAERWREVVLDAHRFAWSWATDAAEAGWTMSELIGFDASAPEAECLVRALRGSRVANLTTDERGRRVAAIGEAGAWRWHYAGRPAAAEPLWTLNRSESR